jgi:ketosteroid isomerase-like protein
MPRVKPLQAALMATPDETEAQFYEALQHADLDRVMSVWSDDEDIACIHPGGPRLVGAQAIRSAFESLFANGSVDARISQVRRIVAGGFAMSSKNSAWPRPRGRSAPMCWPPTSS